jgi:hypothetical protein
MAVTIEDPLTIEVEHEADAATRRWVHEFRGRDRYADRWALGNAGVRHTVETQDRVFRMAQLMRPHSVQDPDASVFEALASGDRTLADIQEFGDPRPAAAYTGFVVLNVLSGRRRSWLDLRGRYLPKEGWRIAPTPRTDTLVVLTDRILNPDERHQLNRWWRASGGGFVVTIVIGRPSDEARFRRQGLDPIVFDSGDPAAHAWGIFEVECRLRLCAEACNPAAELLPIGLAVDAIE